MNYFDKSDLMSSADALGLVSGGQGHVETITQHAAHVPADAIIVPDANLLFNGDLKRSGVDLILSKDGHELLFHDYFRGEKRATLASPDGSRLTGDIVNALAGYTQFAQADGAPSVGHVIGHVTKLTGSATAIRNGVSIILNNGDNVEKGDVVQAGSDSTLGITFIDGTVFGLSSNAKMVLNEMIYDPNGSNNSSLISLIQGTISFVAGETAKHGDMKVDTPVATMGIRGTAVLVEIDFTVSQGGTAPPVTFQVLVEPDGTTGSYILYDKSTLAAIATVNQANTQTTIDGQGNVNFSTTAPLPPDAQKIIQDVFAQKFTDNSNNVNPQTTTAQTSTVNPYLTTTASAEIQTLTVQPANSNALVTLNVMNIGSTEGPSSSSSLPFVLPSTTVGHINVPPTIVASSGSVTALGVPSTSALDVVLGMIRFVDVNAGDTPTVVTTFPPTFTFSGVNGSTPTALQLTDIRALETQLSLVASSGNNNNGSATWTYSVPDQVVEFLSAGETLTLTYNAQVLVGGVVAASTPFTVTIVGTNDAPVFNTSPQTIAFSGGTSVAGGDLSSSPVSGTLSFSDVNLDDTHTLVSAKLTSAVLPGSTVPTGPLSIFENAFSASIITDSTGTGSGTVGWQLANLPVYLADIVPRGETLALTYTVTIEDSQGATSSQTVTVDITGTDNAAVVWIATGSASGGFWSDGSNWETGLPPGASDDVIITTNQLSGADPSYPVTINAPAAAHSLTMFDYGTPPPKLLNQSTLAVGGHVGLNNDSIVNNLGTITIGGLFEVLDSSVVENSGLISLSQGGDFKDRSSITNSGTIDVKGGTLNVVVGIDNSGGTITVENTATLALSSATVTSGKVMDDGTLNLTGTAALTGGTLVNGGQLNVTGSGNALDDEAVSNSSTMEVLAGGTLTIDQGSTVDDTSGKISVDGSGALTLDGGTQINGGGTGTLTVESAGAVDVTGAATLDGIVVTDSNASDGIDATTSGAVLTLDGGTQINGGGTGTLTVESAGAVDVTGAATLDGVIVTDSNATDGIDVTGTLTLDGGTQINSIDSGALKIGATGEVDVNGAATLDGVVVTDSNASDGIDVTTSGAVLTLDGGTQINSTDSGALKIGATGAVDVTGAATLDGVVVTDSNASDGIDVTTSGAVLTLDGGTQINSTDSGALKIGTTGAVDVTGAATLDGVVVTDSNASDGIDVTTSGAVLTLDGGTQINGGGTGTLTVESAGAVDVTGAATLDGVIVTDSNATDGIDVTGTLTLDGGTQINSIDSGALKIGATGAVDVTGAATLDGVVVTDSNAGDGIDVTTSGAVLTLDGGTQINSIDSGALKIGATGAVDVTGAATLDGVVVTDSNASDGIDVTTSGAVLTLDGGTQINSIDSGALKIGATGEVDVNGAATLDGIVVTDSNASDGIDVTTSGAVLTLDGGTQINSTDSGALKIGTTGAVDVTGAATLDGVVVTDSNASDGIDVTTSGAVLTLDGGTQINGGGTGTLTVESAGAVDVTGAATLDGVIVTDSNATDGIDVTGTLTLDGGTQINSIDSGALKIGATGEVDVNGAATLDGVVVTDSNAGDGIDVTTSGAVLTLDGGTQINSTDSGALKIGATGAVDVTGAATLDGVVVTDSNASDGIDVTTSGAVLTLDGGTQINSTDSGALKIGTTGAVDVTGAATLDGIVVTDSNASDGIDVTTSGAVLTLDGGTQINSIDSGALKIGATGAVDVTGAATLDGIVVTDSNASDGIDVTTSGAVLTLDGGTQINSTDSGALKIGTTGAVDVTGAATLDGVVVTDSNASDGIDVTTSGAVLTLDGGTQINGGGTGTLTVESAGAVDVTGAATLDGVIVTDSNATDGIGVTGTLTLDGGTQINGGGTGTLTVESAGAVDVTGAATLDGVIVTDSNATDGIDVTGALTLDGGTQINGGGTGTLTVESAGAVDVTGAATLDGVVVTDSNASDGIDVTGTLTLDGGTQINDGGTGTLNNSGTIANLSGNESISAGVTNTGTITVAAGTLDLSGELTGIGSLIVDGGATLELAGADAQTVNFAGGSDTLQLDNALGFSGTITGKSSSGGTFIVTGPGSVTTSTGDAIDFTSSGGTFGNPAAVTMTPSGNITGALNGINVVQKGVGDITIDPLGNVVGQTGDGVIAEQSSNATGNIFVDATGSLTGIGTGSFGLLAEISNAADGDNITITSTGGASGGLYGIKAVTYGNGNITVESDGSVTASGGAAAGQGEYGIRAQSHGSGDLSVTTDPSSIVKSDGAGLNVVNDNAAILASANSTITVTTNGTINSGSILNSSGGQPSGIDAGYFGSTGTANANINGTVAVNNYADITAAVGDAVKAYNYGNGDVTVNDEASTVVSGTEYGLAAEQLSGGTGNVAVNVDVSAAVTGTSVYGILALNDGSGNTAVTMSASDVVNSGASGIVAINQATYIAPAALSTVEVTAHGTINSGATANNNGSAPAAINAGYFPGDIGTANESVAGNVTVQSDAILQAAAGYGIEAYNYGIGNVTVTTGLTSSITVIGTSGTAIGAFAHDGGDVSVTYNGIGTGSTGITASANGSGNVTVNTDVMSSIIGSTDNGINANATGGGDVSVTNDGVVAGEQDGINADAVGSGTVSVTNDGTVTSTIYSAINVNAVNGSTSIINNESVSGQDGIYVGSSGPGSISITNSGAVEATIYNGIYINNTGTASNVSIMITNSGTVSGYENNRAIGVNENAVGAVTINNDDDGIIGATATAETSTAISANSGSLIINNDGQIYGSVYFSANTIFNNNAGATWQSGYVDDEGTITATGVASTTTILGTNSINVGLSNNASLLLENGAALNASYLNIGQSGTTEVESGANLDITNFLDDEGALIATGADSAITTTGTSHNIDVGFSNSGSFEVYDDAVVTTNTLDIGQQSWSLETLQSGIAGTVTVESGGTIKANYVSIDSLAGSIGTLTIDGAGSTVTTPILYLGSASATITITNGGVLNTPSQSGTYSVEDEGAITVSGSGSAISIVGASNGIDVGLYGNATLTLEDGAVLTTGYLNIGQQSWTNAVLQSATKGTVDVTGGATVAAKNIFLDSLNGSAGALIVDGNGSIVTTSGFSLDSALATITVTNGGSIDIGSDASTVSNAIHVGAVDSLQGDGIINANVVDDGNIAATDGALEITGELTGEGSANIGDGATLELASASVKTVMFLTGQGTLQLDDPTAFTSIIAGISGSGDILDLGGFDAGAGTSVVTASTTGNYNTSTNTTALLVYDSLTKDSVTLTLAGDQSGSLWTVSSDGNHGANIVDPPASPVMTILVSAAQTIEFGQATSIYGVSLSETTATSGETYTVTLTDTSGDLSVSGTGGTITGSGSNDLVISGTLAEVNSYLGTLSDTNGTTGSDGITLTATDSVGHTAAAQTIDVTVDTLGLAFPGAQTIEVGLAASIFGVGLSEATATSGETFTVTLTDTNGDLSVSGAGGTINGSGSNDLVISGTLAEVNSYLGILSDTNGTTGSDGITLIATDSVGHSAGAQTIDVTVDTLGLAFPGAQTIEVGLAASIFGVGLSEATATSGETFTVTLTDTNGDLSVSGAGGTITGSGSNDLVISGTLAEVNSYLGTLSDTNGTTGSDGITLTATDSVGHSAGAQTIDVTVNSADAPTLGIAAPGAQTVEVGLAASIFGVGLSEATATSGETFTVTLTDTNGDLSVSGAGGTINGSGSNDLVISGTLAEVNSYLGTLSDTNGTTGSDGITLIATDSVGHSAGAQTIDVTVNSADAPTLVIAAPGAQAVEVGQTASISGVSLSEATATSGETFTVTLTDTNGDLSVSGTGGTITGSGSNDTVISGTLAEVNSYLGTLSDTNGTTGSDGITLIATDSMGHAATTQTIHVMVNSDVPETTSLTVASGGSLEIADPVASGQSVAFQGSTGSLTLVTPSTFAALISGFTGNGALSGSNQIDLKGVDYSSSSFSKSYDSISDTLSVSSGANSATLHFAGVYQAANFSFQSDGDGGTIVYDPPVPNTASSAQSQLAATGDAPVVTLAQQVLGGGHPDTFVFNFAAPGHDAGPHIHSNADPLQFGDAQFANENAVMNVAHDDGHGNTGIPINAHDAAAPSEVAKFQLHLADFHVV